MKSSKIYSEESDEGYFLEVDIQYSESLHECHNDLPFFSERMKIEKFEKLFTNLREKTEYVIQMRNLKQTLNHRLVLNKVHRVMKFNQKAWLKPYIEMHTKLRQQAQKKNSFELMNNAFCRKKYGKCEEI